MNNEQHSSEQKPETAAQAAEPSWLRLVRRQVDSLEFGTVQITVHDSAVTEVVRAEKMRLERAQRSGIGINRATGAER